MKIIVNSDTEYVKKIRELLRANDGYCPCRLVRSDDTKCICKEFREQADGACHCGLYIKVNDEA